MLTLLVVACASPEDRGTAPTLPPPTGGGAETGDTGSAPNPAFTGPTGTVLLTNGTDVGIGSLFFSSETYGYENRDFIGAFDAVDPGQDFLFSVPAGYLLLSAIGVDGSCADETTTVPEGGTAEWTVDDLPGEWLEDFTFCDMNP